MTDMILEVYELVRERPYTIRELVENLDSSTSFIWKKAYALSELGKIELNEGSTGHWVAYPKSSMGIEAAEKQAIENLREIQK